MRPVPIYSSFPEIRDRATNNPETVAENSQISIRRQISKILRENPGQAAFDLAKPVSD